MALNTYITADQFEDRFSVAGRGNLANVVNVASSPKTDDRFLSVITDANEVVDGYVTGRFPDAFTTVPPVLTSVAFAIARYKLVAGRRDIAGDITSIERVEYEDAIAYLKDVAAGKALFPVEKAATDPAGSVRRVTLGGQRNAAAQTKFGEVLDSLA